MNRKAAKTKLLKWIEKNQNGCWEWKRCRLAAGYGMIVVENKLQTTHRLAWLLFKGPIPKGKHVCHKCDNPSCCNPGYLFIGDNAVNTADRHRKGRDASGQRNGNAKLTDKDVQEIRRRYDGQYGRLTELSKEFGVCTDQIRNVVRGHQRMTRVGQINWVSSLLRRTDKRQYLGGKKSNSS